MNIRRALSVTKRIFLGLRNEKRTLALIFVAPIIAMFVFGLAFSGDVKDVHVVVVNKDAGLQIAWYACHRIHFRADYCQLRYGCAEGGLC